MRDSLKKTSDLLIRSFLVRDLSDSLMVAHFDEQPEQFAHIAHVWWVTWAIRSHRSCLVSHLNDLLISVIKKREWANRSLFLNQKTFIKHTKKSLTVAHLSWATWAICSQLLFRYEGPERFAHSRLFVLSDLSKLVTVAHFLWAKWANERIPSPGVSLETR